MTAPLAGRTVVVTRPAAQAGRFLDLLHDAGATTLALPALRIDFLSPSPELRDSGQGRAWDWAIYTSTNAVAGAIAAFGSLPIAKRVAAVGRATARALIDAGREPDLRPDTANSEGLLASPELAEVSGQSVLLVKGEGGRDLLQATLTARGAEVHLAITYRRAVADPPAGALERLQAALANDPSRLVVAVTSVDVLDALLQQFPAPLRENLREATVLVPGDRVAEAAVRAGWRGRILRAETAEDPAMLAALVADAARTPPAAC